MTAQAGAILNTSSAWDAVDWRTIEDNVRRLQARIVKGAAKEMEQGESLATSSYALGQRQVTCRAPGNSERR